MVVYARRKRVWRYPSAIRAAHGAARANHLQLVGRNLAGYSARMSNNRNYVTDQYFTNIHILILVL
jgi:hypothetical protein